MWYKSLNQNEVHLSFLYIANIISWNTLEKFSFYKNSCYLRKVFLLLDNVLYEQIVMFFSVLQYPIFTIECAIFKFQRFEVQSFWKSAIWRSRFKGRISILVSSRDAAAKFTKIWKSLG